MWPLYLIRVCGLLVDEEKALLIEQDVGNGRHWYFPGGKVETTETLEEGLVREFFEETGISIRLGRLLFISDTNFNNPSMIHILFEVKKVGGSLTLPPCSQERNPIKSIIMVEIDHLYKYGFSEHFIKQLKLGFPDSGAYIGNDQYFDLIT